MSNRRLCKAGKTRSWICFGFNNFNVYSMCQYIKKLSKEKGEKENENARLFALRQFFHISGLSIFFLCSFRGSHVFIDFDVLGGSFYSFSVLSVSFLWCSVNHKVKGVKHFRLHGRKSRRGLPVTAASVPLLCISFRGRVPTPARTRTRSAPRCVR